jgi:hypothetical protein
MNSVAIAAREVFELQCDSLEEGVAQARGRATATFLT